MSDQKYAILWTILLLLSLGLTILVILTKRPIFFALGPIGVSIASSIILWKIAHHQKWGK